MKTGNVSQMHLLFSRLLSCSAERKVTTLIRWKDQGGHHVGIIQQIAMWYHSDHVLVPALCQELISTVFSTAQENFQGEVTVSILQLRRHRLAKVE